MLTKEQLSEFMSYNPETGDLVWIKKPSKKTVVGSVAGCVDRIGRLIVGFQGHLYYAHRLAWLLHYGKWPDHVIDHINGDRADNRISNLRDVSQSVNTQNQRKAHSKNKTSGLLGVSWDKARAKWIARVVLHGKVLFSKGFDSAEDAHQAYVNAKREFHAGCTI